MGRGASCISRVRWNIRQEPSQALGYRQMRDDGVAKPRVWQVRQHRGLHCCHDLARLGANHRESENTIVTTNESFHKSLYFIGRVRPQDGAHREPCDATMGESASTIPNCCASRGSIALPGIAVEIDRLTLARAIVA